MEILTDKAKEIVFDTIGAESLEEVINMEYGSSSHKYRREYDEDMKKQHELADEELIKNLNFGMGKYQNQKR